MGDGYWRPGNVHPFPSSGGFGSPQWNDRKSKKSKRGGEKGRGKSKRGEEKGRGFTKVAEPKKKSKGKKRRLREWVSPRLRGQPPDWKEGN